MRNLFSGTRRHVRRELGDAAAVRGLAYRFGDWLERGPDANRATVREVELTVAKFLAEAAAIGRRQGIGVGIGIGLAIMIIIDGPALLYWVVS